MTTPLPGISCDFGKHVPGGRECIRIAGADGMCPRHSFMVNSMGIEEAERVEFAEEDESDEAI